MDSWILGAGGRFNWWQLWNCCRSCWGRRKEYGEVTDKEQETGIKSNSRRGPRNRIFIVGIYILIRKWIRENQANSSRLASTAPSTRCSWMTSRSSIRQHPEGLPAYRLTSSRQNTLVMTLMSQPLPKIICDKRKLQSIHLPIVILYCFYLLKYFIYANSHARFFLSILN